MCIRELNKSNKFRSSFLVSKLINVKCNLLKKEKKCSLVSTHSSLVFHSNETAGSREQPPLNSSGQTFVPENPDKSSTACGVHEGAVGPAGLIPGKIGEISSAPFAYPSMTWTKSRTSRGGSHPAICQRWPGIVSRPRKINIRRAGW